MPDPFAKQKPTPGNWSSYGAPGLPIDKGPWSAEKAIVQGLEMCSWVYACVEMRGKAASSVPWIVEKRRGRSASSRTWERAYGHPKEELLARPNESMSMEFLIHFQSMHLDTGGNALFKKVMARGETQELWPLNPVKAEPLRGKSKWVEEYRVWDGPKQSDIPAEFIIHAQRPNPRNPIWGLSPLQVLASVVDMDVAMTRSNRLLAGNSNMPPAIISAKSVTDGAKLSQAQDAIDAKWGQDQRGKPLVIPAGDQFIRLALTPQELDFVASQQWSVTQICAPFDVLPAIFSPNAATYDNLSASLEHLWEAGVIPQLNLFRDAFNLALLSKEESKTTWITYDLSNVKALKAQFTRNIIDFKNLVQTGVPAAVANDRTELGLPAYEGDDKPVRFGSPAPAAGEQAMVDGDNAVEDAAGPGKGKSFVSGFERKAAVIPSGASTPDVEDVSRRVERIAAKVGPAIAALFLKAVNALASKIDRSGLLSTLLLGSKVDPDEHFPLASLEMELRSLGIPLAKAYGMSADAAAAEIVAKVGTDFGADPDLGKAVARAAELAGLLTDSTRRGLDWILGANARTSGEGITADASKVADLATQSWGLNLIQAQGLLSFAQQLSENGTEGAEAMTAKYASASLRERAKSVGDAESYASATDGQVDTWRAAKREGVIEGRRRWIDSGDGKVCPECLSLGGQEVDLDEDYSSPLSKGRVTKPGPGGGAHGGGGDHECRCGEVLVYVEE